MVIWTPEGDAAEFRLHMLTSYGHGSMSRPESQQAINFKIAVFEHHDLKGECILLVSY
jgi:hypothetical protein